jgi:uncharacterized membrane protein (DUF373 family)
MAAPRWAFGSARVLRLIDRGEKLIALVLTALLLAVTAAASLQLFVFSAQQLLNPGTAWLEGRLNALLGDLLILLIALEVLQNITAYLRRGIVQIQLVLITAITAVARKVIVLPPGEESKPQLLIGLGVAVLCLAAAYWLVRQPSVSPRLPRTGRARSFPELDRSPPPGDGGRPE